MTFMASQYKHVINTDVMSLNIKYTDSVCCSPVEHDNILFVL